LYEADKKGLLESLKQQEIINNNLKTEMQNLKTQNTKKHTEGLELAQKLKDASNLNNKLV
jgi:DNA repair exonuclease SbcCD ATPase subunit